MKISDILSPMAKLCEAKDYFDSVDVIKLDPDRADAYDVVQALMPTLIRIAYVNMAHDKERYDRTHTDEEDDPFEFTIDELEDRLDDLVKNIRDRLDDQTSHDKHAYIDRIKSEFKEKIDEAK